jgi:hypothetical protein
MDEAPVTSTISFPTGRDIAFAAADDFSSFFMKGSEFPVAIRFDSVASPCIRKANGSTCIVLPHEMGAEIIDTPDELFFHLLIIGHEIAHLVHNHLEGASQQAVEDYLSLELWADFYGAKVMMTLCTFGPKIFPLILGHYPTGDIFSALESVGAAVGRLVSTVYRDSNRYPARLVRVGLTCNGVTSFLRHQMGSRFVPIMYYSVFKRVFSSSVVQELMILHPESAEFDAEPVMRPLRWHREQQGLAHAITPGFHPEVLEFLHTTFGQTDDEVRESERIRRNELRDAGFDV